jgi:DNA-binding response OmpR family regulator
VLEGFARGADDYLTKPFDLEILKAKVRALFKRTMLATPHTQKSQHRLIFDNLIIDTERCEVTLNKQAVSLTTLEYDLLYFLAGHPNRVWDRSELMAAVWGSQTNPQGSGRRVDVHLAQIRKKIADPDGRLIRTLRGKGYMFESPAARDSSREA